jgi:hypothetical protein
LCLVSDKPKKRRKKYRWISPICILYNVAYKSFTSSMYSGNVSGLPLTVSLKGYPFLFPLKKAGLLTINLDIAI